MYRFHCDRPDRLEQLEVNVLDALRGADSIEAGKWASVIGFVGVIIFMALSYGRFGLAANTALIVNLILICLPTHQYFHSLFSLKFLIGEI